MNPLLHAALLTRLAIATPARGLRLKRLAAESCVPVCALFYHRIADSVPNDWTLSRKQFRKHVDYCVKHLEVVDLAEVQRRVRDRDSKDRAVTFTFDDGYRDNFDFAIPLLIERGVPCTYFVTTSHIRDQIAFPHDEQAGRPLAANTVAQLREMSDAGIEIGCHTRHHVDFNKVRDRKTIRAEIIDAKYELEQMIGREVRYFAFPYGLPEQLRQAAIEAVAEAGFLGFCSAYGGYNLVGRDSFHIRRFHGDREFSRLKNWLTLDPRKIKREPDVTYRLPAINSRLGADGEPETGEAAAASFAGLAIGSEIDA